MQNTVYLYQILRIFMVLIVTAIADYMDISL